MEIRKAELKDAEGIKTVCSDGYRQTYPDLISPQHIEKVIQKFYNVERIESEITTTGKEWNGWFVAVEQNKVAGAGGGGFIAEGTAELFVLYLDPARKRQGIGTQLLDAITKDQVERGAKEQWVSVAKGNAMGIPFYEAIDFEFQSEQPAYEMDGYTSLRYKRTIRD